MLSTANNLYYQKRNKRPPVKIKGAICGLVVSGGLVVGGGLVVDTMTTRDYRIIFW